MVNCSTVDGTTQTRRSAVAGRRAEDETRPMTNLRAITTGPSEASRRRYHSPVRRAQAAATRAAIVAAAAHAFRTRGFARTAVGVIARDAGVSVQTLYDSVGGKHEVLLAVLNQIDGSHFPTVMTAVAESRGPSEAIDAWVGGLRTYMETNAPLVRAALEAGDVAARGMVAEGHARHLDGAVRLVRRIGELGGLPNGVDEDEAALAVAIATVDSSWYFAVDTGGKTWDEAEVIFANTVARILLGPRAISANCA